MPKKDYRNSSRKRSIGRRVSDWFHDLPMATNKWLGRVTDQFEWFFHRLFAGIGNVFTGIASIVFPKRLVDRARKGQTKRAEIRAEQLEAKGTSKFLEESEYWFHNLVAGVGGIFSGIYRLFAPTKLVESTEKAISQKAAAVAWDIRYRLNKFYKWLTPAWLQKLLTHVQHWLKVVTKFVVAWFRSRDFKRLAWAAPAILCAVPLLGAVVLAALYSKTDKIQHYQRELTTALVENRKDEQQLYLSKLTQLGYQRIERAEFHLALALADEGNWEEAYTKMQLLAPDDELGLPQAHLWIAAALFDESVDRDDRWQLIESHVKRVNDSDSNNTLAQRLLVEVDLHYERVGPAIDAMEKLTRHYPDMHVTLMHLYRVKQDLANARRHARKSIDVLSEANARSESDATPLAAAAYLRWASAHELLGEIEESKAMLALGLEKHPTDRDLKRTMSAMVSNALQSFDFANPETKSQLAHVLQSDPQNQIALLLLAKGLLTNDKNAQRVVAELREQALVDPKLYLLVGDAMSRENRRDDAVQSYREALQVDPKTARAWNNIAWIYANTQPIQLEQALEASHNAIKLDPDSRYLETRGQILVQMGRWQQGASDLEQALNGMLPNSAPAHMSLAIAYERLGESEQARAHRDLANSH